MNTRVMMMPFHTHDPIGSLPALNGWREYVAGLCSSMGAAPGVGYLTIDEAFVPAGETQRRPGLHVDGVGDDGRLGGGWGGGGGWSRRGAILVSNDGACNVFSDIRESDAGPGGDCAHLHPGRGRRLQPWEPAWIGPLTLHEAVPAKRGRLRRFCRISMPSAAPWFEGYSVNPFGIQPTGPVLARRSELDYRAVAS